MANPIVRLVVLWLALLASTAAAEEIQRIWLSHASPDNSRVVVCPEGPAMEGGSIPA